MQANIVMPTAGESSSTMERASRSFMKATVRCATRLCDSIAPLMGKQGVASVRQEMTRAFSCTKPSLQASISLLMEIDKRLQEPSEHLLVLACSPWMVFQTPRGALESLVWAVGSYHLTAYRTISLTLSMTSRSARRVRRGFEPWTSHQKQLLWPSPARRLEDEQGREVMRLAIVARHVIEQVLEPVLACSWEIQAATHLPAPLRLGSRQLASLGAKRHQIGS